MADNNLKVAVCVYGISRGNKKCWKSLINNIIKPNTADVFIHSWITNEKIKSNGTKGFISNKKPFVFINYLIKSKIFPREFHVTEQCTFEPFEIYEATGHPWKSFKYSNLKNMMISMVNVINYASLFSRYDFIILTREDLLFETKLDLQSASILKNISGHGGIWNSEKEAYDCEDLLMIFCKKDIKLFCNLLERHNKLEFYENKVYNIFHYCIEQQEAKFHELPYKYGKDFHIARHRTIFRKIRAYLKKLWMLIT
jgi:hypothetical protein